METRTVRQSVTFKASAHDLYDTLMDSEKHGKLTDSKAFIDPRVGGRISAYDGYIIGENLELVEDKKIVQRWRGSDWPEGHFSEVTFEFIEGEGSTVVVLTHVGVPEDELDMVDQAWQKYYWEPIREALERG